MIDCDVIVERVCQIPAEFRRVRTKSVIQLAEEIGLPEYRRCITWSAVESQLKAQPELVDDWLRWSEDKRTSSGWYISENDEEVVVGCYPDAKEQRFADRTSACAQFVVHEMEDIMATMAG